MVFTPEPESISEDSEGPPPLIPVSPASSESSTSGDEDEDAQSPGKVIQWLRTLQEYGFHFQFKAQVQDIADGFRELGLSREEEAELDRIYADAPIDG